MYGEFFGLRCLPFEDRADTQFTFLTPEFEETLAQLEYEGRFGNRSLLITGDAGTGKTQLIRSYLIRLHATDHAVVLTWPVSGDLDPIREACKGFGVMIPSTGSGRDRRFPRLQRHLSRTRQAGHRSILIVDQADHLTRQDLAQVATLADIQDETGALLTLVLVGQPRIRERLDEPELARLKQRLFGERQLAPLSASQTGSYIRHRLSIAGAADEELFDTAAIERIHRASKGIPRLINHLCHAAMIAAYGSGETRITRDKLQGVNDAELECQRTVSADEMGGSAAGLTAPALPMQSPRSARRAPTPSEMAAAAAIQAISPRSGDRSTDGDPGGMADPLATSMASLFCRGEALLERLERALSRADHVTATTESSLTHFAAVERHLTTLVNAAERVTTGSKTTAAAADGDIDHLKRLTDPKCGSALDLIIQLDARIAQAAKVSEELTYRLSNAATVYERGPVLEARLTLFADELADKAEDVRRRIAELVQGAQDTAGARCALQEVIQAANLAGREQEAKARTVTADLQSTIRCAEQLQLRCNTDTVTAAQRALEEASHEAERSLRAIAAQLIEESRGVSGLERRALVDSLNVIIDEAKSQLRGAAEGIAAERHRVDEVRESMVGDARKVREELETAFRRHEERMGASLTQYRGQMEAVLTETREQLEPMTRQISEIHSKHRGLIDAIPKLVEQVRAERVEAETVAEDLHRQTAAATDERAKNEAATAGLGVATRQADEVFDRVQTARGQLEEIHRRFTSDLADLVRGEERTKNLREDCVTASSTAQALSTLGETATKLTAELAGRLEQATKLDAAVSLANRLAEEHGRQLASHNAAATHTLRELAAKTAIGRKAVEEIQTGVESVEGSLAAAREHLEQWAGSEPERVRAVEQLAEWSASARRLNDELQVGIDQAGPLVHELISRVGEGTALNTELTATNESARTLIAEAGESVERARRDATECERRHLQWVAKTCLLNAKAETLAEEIGAQLDRTRAASTRLAEGIIPGEQLVAELTSAMGDAQERLSELRNGTIDAASIAEQLAGIEHLVAAIHAAEEALGQSVANAHSVRETIADLLTTAHENATTLETLQAQSTECVATQERVNGESAEACTRLSEYVTTSRDLVESGRSLLECIVEQREAVEAKVIQLTEEAARIERSLSEAADAPAAAVEAARVQIAQLNKVCAAVRKVFAGLSQATLEARDRTAELQDVQRQMGQGLARLFQDTERAAKTLEEWVGEAIRAHERLEQTVQTCPSLGELHSRDRLLGLSRTASSLGKLRERLTIDPLIAPPVPSSAANGFESISAIAEKPRTADIIAPRPPAVCAPDPVIRHQERAAEIAQMIEEAKLAAASPEASVSA